MIFEIEVSEQADRDLRNIYEYIAFELQSSENAVGQLDRLEERISLDHCWIVFVNTKMNCGIAEVCTSCL